MYFIPDPILWSPGAGTKISSSNRCTCVKSWAFLIKYHSHILCVGCIQCPDGTADFKLSTVFCLQTSVHGSLFTTCMTPVQAFLPIISLPRQHKLCTLRVLVHVSSATFPFSTHGPTTQQCTTRGNQSFLSIPKQFLGWSYCSGTLTTTVQWYNFWVFMITYHAMAWLNRHTDTITVCTTRTARGVWVVKGNPESSHITAHA